MRVKTPKSSSTAARRAAPWLKIGDAAALAGVSASVLRSWEQLGLVRPQRTDSRYRLYTAEDVRLLRRARFLRKQRGLNVHAILHMLKREGALRKSGGSSSEGAALGRILRRLRDQRGLSLQKVAEAVGISTGFLSALERSQMSASVGTMRKLARFYKINILDMFEPGGSNPRLVRPQDRKRLQAGRGVRMDLLAWGNTVMEPHLFRIAPAAGSGGSYSHHGEEFLYVIRGELAIELDGEHYRLKSGDSFYFDSSTTHQWSNPGQRETWVLWINTPPTF